MKYSVWNPGTRRYDYYEAQSDGATHAGAPPRASTSELGATPEQAAWPLPADAVKAGSGELPQGRIASTEAKPVSFDKVFLAAAAAYFIWRVIK